MVKTTLCPFNCCVATLLLQIHSSLNGLAWILQPTDRHRCYCKNSIHRKADAAYRGRPPELYTLPEDWFLFKVYARDTFQDILHNWHICYHGTDVDKLESILHIGLRIPGDRDMYGHIITEQTGHYNEYNKPYGFETERIFLSPSILYAGCDVYAHPHCYKSKITGSTYEVKVAVLVLIKPGSYDVSGSTIEEQSIDPIIADAEIEWSTNQRNRHVVTGFLVRFDRYECTGHPNGWTCWTF
ncbi:hypothetical protein ACJMK2_041368 [Sinanodonta woodiana]|uniref:Uncharacterized protein n=1 Tax=Sinanodonta woodiana TaxID=1069815 RepID=A0ABD3W755_SINWO